MQITIQSNIAVSLLYMPLSERQNCQLTSTVMISAEDRILFF